MLAAILIFAGTYLVIAIGRLPGFRVDRTGAAIVGASLMIASNVVMPAEAWAAIRHETIMLLFGMMIVVANLRLSGFFAVVSAWVVEHAHPSGCSPGSSRSRASSPPSSSTTRCVSC